MSRDQTKPGFPFFFMQALLPTFVQCPSCWEEIEIVVDTSQGDYEAVEDCSVCCRPFTLVVCCRPGEVHSVEVAPA